MADLDLTKDYSFGGQRISFGGVYSDFFEIGFNLPFRSIVFENPYMPLYFDTIKYIRQHNEQDPGELPTTNHEFLIYPSEEVGLIIGSYPVMGLLWAAIPNTSPTRFTVQWRFRDKAGDYGYWDPIGSYQSRYFNDEYIGVDPDNVTGEDHWRQGLWFLYQSNIDGYGVRQDIHERFGFSYALYKWYKEDGIDIEDGYTFPGANDYGTPLPELDDSYPGPHRVFSWGSYFQLSIDGNATAYFGSEIWYVFLTMDEITEDLPGNYFDVDDDEAPPIPESGYDPNGYDGKNDLDYDTPSLSVLTSGLFQLFLPSTAEMQAFASYLWSSNYEDSLKRYGMKPMDNIVNFGIIPFDLTSLEGSTAQIELCGAATGVYMTKATRSYFVKTLPSIRIDPQKLTGTYLDYQHCNLSMYIPCVGFVQLKAPEVVGRSVGLQYRIDISTGDFIAFLYVTGNGIDRRIMSSYTGNCMYKLPLTSADYASYYQQIRRNATNLIGSAGSLVGGAAAGFAMGGIGGAIAGGALSAVQSINSAWDSIEGLKMAQPEVSRGGDFTGCLAYLGYKTPFIIIDVPNTYKKGFYDYYSYPTMRNMQLSQCKGWTHVARCNLDGITCTQEEKNMIRALLKDGVYIKSAL